MAHLSARDPEFAVETERLRLRWPAFADAPVLGRLFEGLAAPARRELSGLLRLAPHEATGAHLAWAARRGNLTGGGLVLLAEPRDGGAPYGLLDALESLEGRFGGDPGRDGIHRPRAFGPAPRAWRPEAVIALRAALRHASPARRPALAET